MEPISDYQVTDFYDGTVLPFWQQQVKTGEFEGFNGISIAYAYALHPEAIGSVAISSGRIESLVKYKELVYDFYQQGYSVFIHDHRGQGLSGRMRDNSHSGYVDDFSDYVTDFKIFYDSIIAPNSQTKPKLVCHSMGGAIGALYVLTHPQDFSCVAFSAPMFGVQPALPHWLGKCLIGLHALVKSKPEYFFGQGDYAPDRFEDNHLTHSQARYAIFRKEYDAQPKVYLGGITGTWLDAALDAMKTIKHRAAEICLPVLIMHAGEDQIVHNGSQQQVAERIPDCQTAWFDGAYHELLMEQQQTRVPVLNAIARFWANCEGK